MNPLTKKNPELQCQFPKGFSTKNMKIVNFIEKHCRWLQIPDLPVILAVGYMVFFVLVISQTVHPETIDLYGNPIIHNKEYWRLFTFTFYIDSDPIFILFTIYLQWLFGSVLENTYGSLRFTLYFFTTTFIAVIFCLLLPNLRFNDSFAFSVFLAFALIFPDYILWIFFVIPIKIKWLALIGWVTIGYQLIASKFSGESIALALTIIIPISIFFGKDLYLKIKYKTRKAIIISKKQVEAKKHHHQCFVCQSTDISDPKKEFRYIEEYGKTNCYCDAHIPSPKKH